MPGGFSVYSATANCGNGSLGPKTVNEFKQLVKKEKLDAIIINCQEARFADIQAELASFHEDGYTVTQIGGMNTATDFWENTHFLWPSLNGPAGIGSFIIHKKNISVQSEDTIQIRASDKRWLGNKNKGGQVARIKLQRNATKDTVDLDLISAHYESFDTVQRAQDHFNVYQAHQSLINDTYKKKLPLQASITQQFKAISKAIPEQLFYGADTNVRNRLDDATCIWQFDDAIELTSLKNLPLVNTQFSAKNTHGKLNSNPVKDKKRKGFQGEALVKGGSLDINGYLNFTDDNNSKNHSSNPIDIEEKKKRDHVIIGLDNIIHLSSVQKTDDDHFEKVKFYIACRLKKIRPKLAQSIIKLNNTEESKEFILNIFKQYFSIPTGVINKIFTKHQEYIKSVYKELNGFFSPFLNGLNQDLERKEFIRLMTFNTDALWKEPETQEYEKLIRFQSETIDEKKKILSEMDTLISTNDVVSSTHISNNVFSALKAQLGNYDSHINSEGILVKTDIPKEKAEEQTQLKTIITDSLSDNCSKSLYDGINEYQIQHQKQIEQLYPGTKISDERKKTFFREQFIQFLEKSSLPKASIFQEAKRLSSPTSATTSIKHFLGKEGVKLFKLAMKEELHSKEFRDAVYFNSSTLVKGEEWQQKPVHFIGGSSSSGKTYIAQKLIPDILKDLGLSDEKNGPGNLMVQVDGGIIRSTSQIRKLLVQISQNQGFTGIDDLQDYVPKGFSKLKEKIRQTVLDSEKKVGLIIPETFSFGLGYTLDPNDVNMVEQAAKKQDTKLFFTRLGPDQTENMSTFERINKGDKHREMVQFCGEKRAFKSSNFHKKPSIDLNCTDIEESKKYNSQSYNKGHDCSRLMEERIIKHVPNATVRYIRDDREVVKSKTGTEKPFVASRRVIDAWNGKENALQKLIGLRDRYKGETNAPHSLQGFTKFLEDKKQLPPSMIEIIQRPTVSSLNAFSPLHSAPLTSKNEKTVLHKKMSPSSPSSMTFFTQEKELELKKLLLSKVNYDIFNQTQFNEMQLRNKVDTKILNQKLTELNFISALLLSEKNKKNHIDKINNIIIKLQKIKKKISSDILVIQKVLKGFKQPIRADFNSKINEKIQQLENEVKTYQVIIDELSNIHKIIKNANKITHSKNLGLSEITTTIIDKIKIRHQLGQAKPFLISAKVKGPPLKSLPPIPKDKVALHTFKYKDEVLAFIETSDHEELKAVKPKKKVSKNAKIQLAFIMAQKFIMNFDGIPTIEKPIYLNGKDLELIEMLHASLVILSDKGALNFDAKAIIITSDNYQPSFDTDKSAMSMVAKMQKVIDKDLMQSAKSLSKSVHTIKEKMKSEDPIDEITDVLSPLTTP